MKDRMKSIEKELQRNMQGKISF